MFRSFAVVVLLIVPRCLSSTSPAPSIDEDVSCRHTKDYTICCDDDVLLNVSQHRETSSVNIHHLGLTEIREDAFRNVSTARLSLRQGNRISRLWRESFRGLGNLEELHLDNNRVTPKPYLFAELKKLRILYLSFNRIKDIPDHAFDGLPFLKRLFLWYNHLSMIEARVFAGLEDTLQFLSLDNNRIERLVPGAFEQLRELTYLHLKHNLIDRIVPGSFQGLRNLTGLFLDYNSLARITEADFHGLASLQMLNLQYNEIGTIEKGSFHQLQGLRMLNLGRNRLTHIPLGIFNGLSKLNYLDLSYNLITLLDAGALNSANIETLHFIHNNMSDVDEAVAGLPQDAMIYS